MSNKIYDILKQIAIIGLSALGSLYSGLALIWDLPYANEIPKTLDVIGTFLGVILGISHYNYTKQKDNSDSEES